ncbi:molybdopterin biosynthesis protein [Pseudoroseomonas cervicalis]|uniref:molybdopterin biosynthesis protein n=1 Tax=Teichococcus cervicalis TaxID=204525 RepID=UPI0027817C2A|nr:molybdopterin biosynthesis protein [Pseudoroseomonas cervicalis]MDQ1081765.1 putative molybdopterin biosynthesis protein [Pseudoroseomonas cervicalis]
MTETDGLLARIRRAARQEQFLEVLPAEEAMRRFRDALELAPLPAETVGLAAALGRVVASPVAAAMDAPPFDRASVDGFALRAADTAGASEAAPRRLRLNAELLACGVAPAIAVAPGTATAIATGGVIPRGADAVLMVEHSALEETPEGPVIAVQRAVAPGQFIGFAGSDIARGETLLRRGAIITAREIGMLAASGHAAVAVVRRPRVAVLSTGDELVPPGTLPLPPGAIADSNAAILGAAVAENGGEALPRGILPDDEAKLEAAVRAALAEADMVVLSGGTSKGAGDVSHRILARLGPPGIVAHGVALKPGKPLCLAVAGGKPVVVLPGFPTSAIFTFHEFVVPVLRALAGLPPRQETEREARLALRTPSELGRTEYVMASLAEAPEGGLAAWPLGKGSGSVTAFAQADGFFSVPALSAGVEAGAEVRLRLIGGAAPLPDLAIMGSHCVGLDAVLDALAAQGVRARSLAVGSLGGLAAARHGECDIAPAHLLDAASGAYNTPYLEPGLTLVPGWRRMQGVVFRPGDARFEGLAARDAVARAAADPACLLVNRNAGSGTRILLDGLLGGARPPGYANQPKSHNAVAAAVAQGRADWGLAIDTVARAYGLGFLPVAEEHYDFFLPEARRGRPAVQAFLAALAEPSLRARLAALGFRPSG